MSTSPDRPEDAIVNVLSHWLAGHVDDGELLATLDGAGTEALGPGETEAVEELRDALREGQPKGELDRTVRETLEALALGA